MAPTTRFVSQDELNAAVTAALQQIQDQLNEQAAAIAALKSHQAPAPASASSSPAPTPGPAPTSTADTNTPHVPDLTDSAVPVSDDCPQQGGEIGSIVEDLSTESNKPDFTGESADPATLQVK